MLPQPHAESPTADAPVPVPTSPPTELEVLDGLEQDLAAVEEAMAGLDSLDADAVGGAEAAARVASIVDSERFSVVNEL